MSEDARTCFEKLEPVALREHLIAADTSNVQCDSDRKLSISANRVRGVVDDRPFVAMSGHSERDELIRGFLDVVYWRHKSKAASEQRACFFVGSDDRRDGAKKTDQALQAIASLNEGIVSDSDKVEVFLDDKPWDLNAPDFAGSKPDWNAKLLQRDRLFREKSEKHSPRLVAEMEDELADTDFRWHMSLSMPHWSGRISGLRVCEVDLKGSGGVVSVGDPKKGARATDAFREIRPEGAFEFGNDQPAIEKASGLLREFSERSRKEHSVKKGAWDPEHHMEDQILREVVKLRDENGRVLKPVLDVSQVPAIWWTDGGARYTDLLMGDGSDTPWTVELKVNTQGQGQYFRHAVGQTVLYRAFLRGATQLAPWFESHNLDQKKCKAAIAIPKPAGANSGDRWNDIKRLAKTFGVTVLEVPSLARESL